MYGCFVLFHSIPYRQASPNLLTARVSDHKRASEVCAGSFSCQARKESQAKIPQSNNDSTRSTIRSKMMVQNCENVN